jgi:hypothetical protein
MLRSKRKALNHQIYENIGIDSSELNDQQFIEQKYKCHLVARLANTNYGTVCFFEKDNDIIRISYYNTRDPITTVEEFKNKEQKIDYVIIEALDSIVVMYKYEGFTFKHLKLTEDDEKLFMKDCENETLYEATIHNVDIYNTFKIIWKILKDIRDNGIDRNIHYEITNCISMLKGIG